MSRRLWTETVSATQEDTILTEQVAASSSPDWNHVARELQRTLQNQHGRQVIRTPKQCKDRWKNRLDPTINSDEWTTAELQVLFDAQRVYGNKWVTISTMLPGRTEIDIKNQFYSTARRNLRKLQRECPTDSQLQAPIKVLLKHPDYSRMILNHTAKGIYTKYRHRTRGLYEETMPTSNTTGLNANNLMTLPPICELKNYYASTFSCSAVVPELRHTQPS